MSKDRILRGTERPPLDMPDLIRRCRQYDAGYPDAPMVPILPKIELAWGVLEQAERVRVLEEANHAAILGLKGAAEERDQLREHCYCLEQGERNLKANVAQAVEQARAEERERLGNEIQEQLKGILTPPLPLKGMGRIF